MGGDLLSGSSGEIFRVRRKIGQAIGALRHVTDKAAEGESVDHADAAMAGGSKLQGVYIVPPDSSRSIARMLRRIVFTQLRTQGRVAALLQLPCGQAEASKRR